PANSETARHTPDLGFIVDRIEAWITGSGGQKKKIAFRFLIPDSESGLENSVSAAIESGRDLTKDPGANGFQIVPNLFHPRWIVGVLAKPIQLSRGTQIKLRLTQTQEID